MYTTINQVRRAFWLSRNWKGFQSWQSQGTDYAPEFHLAFQAFVGELHQRAEIPEVLARNITL